MKVKFASRASEKGLAYYLDKVASYLQRELGMRPRQTLDKVQEATVLEKFYQSDDSKLLADAAENLASKIEIIGLNLIEYRKYKSKSQKAIDQLE